MFNNRVLLFFTGVLITGIFSGCGDPPPPKGTISGTIEFAKPPTSDLDIIILDASTGSAASTSIKDGQFDFGEPVLTGNYVAYLAPQSRPDAQEAFAVTLDKNIPDMYYNETTSPLNFKVDQGNNKVSFVVE